MVEPEEGSVTEDSKKGMLWPLRETVSAQHAAPIRG